jgi:quercetin 2,3-dioxygenase
MKVYKEREHGKGDHGWLRSNFHFSFDQYYNPKRMNCGPLRVLNDDVIQPDSGFPLHPHRDMEIITYVIEGELTHQDSMGSKETIGPGHVQYMSAGTGIYHSESNEGKKSLRLLQIWITPDGRGYEPQYGSIRPALAERDGAWLHIVSPFGGKGLIGIHRDGNIYAARIRAGQKLPFILGKDRQIYGVLISGEAEAGRTVLYSGDGFESQEGVSFSAKEDSHILLIEMEKDL